MNGFSFPPPPPPPPKAAQPSTDQQGFQHGSSDRGRGRGRGNFRGNPRGGIHDRGSSHGSGRGNAFSGGSHQSRSSNQQNSFHLQNHILPPGAFVNPNFAPHANGHPALGNSWHKDSWAQKPKLPNGQSNAQNGALPRTAAGHKRKLEALRGEPREKKPGPETAPAVPSFGALLPLSKIPGLDSTLRAKAPSPANAKRTGKGLGLTPAVVDTQYSSSDSDDNDDEVDEEAEHAELGDKLTFEHNGVVTSLRSQADLMAWKKERQKQWPTKARMAEKEKARRRVGEERKRLLAGAQANRKPIEDRVLDLKSKADHETTNSPGKVIQDDDPLVNCGKVESELDATKRELAEQTRSLDDLRRKVAESEARHREAQAQAEARNEAAKSVEAPVAGADMPDVASLDALKSGVADDMQAGHVENVDIVIPGISDGNDSDSSSNEDSDSDPAADSEDEAPEEVSSKSKAPEESSRPTNSSATICRFFAARGHCRNGDKCAYRHEQHSRNTKTVAPPKQKVNSVSLHHEPTAHKKTIFERLVEQEQLEEDKLALRVIKYLGSAGFFDEVATVEDA